MLGNLLFAHSLNPAHQNNNKTLDGCYIFRTKSRVTFISCREITVIASKMLLRSGFLCTLLTFLSILNKTSGDCGCSNANREERAKKYERSEDSHQHHETENVGRWTSAKDYEHMSLIPKGTYNIGTNDEVFRADKEGPERAVEMKQFYMDKYQVSNEEFEKFVKATSYETEAEKFGDSFVFKIFLTAEVQKEYEDFRVMQGNSCSLFMPQFTLNKRYCFSTMVV
jgi:hypothetical protein